MPDATEKKATPMRWYDWCVALFLILIVSLCVYLIASEAASRNVAAARKLAAPAPSSAPIPAPAPASLVPPPPPRAAQPPAARSASTPKTRAAVLSAASAAASAAALAKVPAASPPSASTYAAASAAAAALDATKTSPEEEGDVPFASAGGPVSRRAASSGARHRGLTRTSVASAAAAAAAASAPESLAPAPATSATPASAVTLASVFGSKARSLQQPEDSHGVLARAHSLEKLKEAAARRPKDVDVDRATFKKRGEEGAEINAMISAFLPKFRAAKAADAAVTPESFLEEFGLAHELPVLEALKLAAEMGAPTVGAPKPPPVFRRVVDRDGADVDNDPAALKRAATLEIPSRDSGVALAIMNNILKARTAAKAAGVHVHLKPSQTAAARVWAKSKDAGASRAAQALLSS